MEFKGKIEKLNHIVLSDPTYKNDIWCRYEKKDLNEKNLLVDMDINVYETDMENYKFKTTEFMLLIKKNKDDCAVEDDKFICSKDIEVKEYEIGIDSACVALGINNKAKEIINSHDEWQPSCAIKTGSDGIFGNVFEGTKDGNFSFILISGNIDNDNCSENELFDYLKNQFEIIELEYTTLNGYGRKLNKGDKVEVSSCVITNDAGGTTIIRNKDYKSVVDGMKLNVELPDGTFEHTTIESHDKLVNLPIEIEVIDEFYDYETGFNYKGKVTNRNLVRQLAEIGITGYIPDDYKIYKDKSLYEKVLKANKNFDPSIVNFSEFDIVKKLDKDCEIEL